MACGCAVLGQSGHFYNGLGLVSGVHYVEHDGTLDGIKCAIDYLRECPEKAQEIAEMAKSMPPRTVARMHCLTGY